MKETYPVARKVKVILFILVPPLLALFGGLGAYPFFEEKVNIALVLLVAPVCLGFFVFFALVLLDALKGTLTIKSGRIVKNSIFGGRALPLEAIAGYRTEARAIVLVPRDTGRKALSISNAYYRDADRLDEWIRATFADLDAVEAREKEERLEVKGLKGAFRKAKIFTWTLTGAAVIVSLWYLLEPLFPRLLLALCLLIPLTGLFAVRLSGGMVKIASFPKSGSGGTPHVAWALLVPAFSVLIRGFVDHAILDYSALWMPALTVFMLIMGALFIGSRAGADSGGVRELSPLIVGPLFAILFSLGFVITTNAVFDPAPPAVYEPVILEKYRETGGKSSSNHFRLGPWGPVTGESSVMVHYRVYDRKSPGDTVTVHLRKGLYGIPSYDVEKQTAP